MKFECDSCHAQYMIADEKVGRRGVKVKCKRCSHVIIVRPPPDGADATDVAAADEPPAPPPVEDTSVEASSGGGEVSRPAFSDEETAFESRATAESPAEPSSGAGASLGFSDETLVGPPPEGLDGLEDGASAASGDTEVAPPHEASSAPRDAGDPPAPPDAGEPADGIGPARAASDEEDAFAAADGASDGGDALEDEIAGAFSEMFDPSQIAASGDDEDDVPAPPPMAAHDGFSREEPDSRSATTVLNLDEVERLRRQSARTEMGQSIPSGDGSLDDMRADLDSTLAELDGASDEATGLGPWGEASHPSHLATEKARPSREEAPSEPEWHVAIDDEDVGPLTLEQIREQIALGRVDRETLVWKSGMADWKAADDVPRIRALFEQVPLPRIAAPPDAPASSSLSGFDVGAPIDDVAPSPFGDPDAFDPFGEVSDVSDPAWQPHGLTEVYQAANLAEAAAGVSSAGTSSAALPQPDDEGEDDVDWKPGAASALASLVQEEIQRIESAPAKESESEAPDLPPAADDQSLAGGLLAPGLAEPPPASAAGLDLATPPAPSMAGLGPALLSAGLDALPPALSNGQGMATYPPPAMSGPAMSVPYVPVVPQSRPVALYATLGALGVVLIVAVIALVKLAFFGGPPAPVDVAVSTPVPPAAPAGAQVTPPAASKEAEPPSSDAPTRAGVKSADPQAAKPDEGKPDESASGAETAKGEAEEDDGAKGDAPPPEPDEAQKEVKVAKAESSKSDGVSRRDKAPSTRKSRSARTSRAPKKTARAPRASQPAPAPKRSAKDCDPVLDFDCEEKPKRAAPSSNKRSRAEASKETLSPSDVLTVVKKNLPRVKACGRKHGVKDVVQMQWRIARSGRTTGVKVLSSKYAGTPVGNCLVAEVRGWRFPAYSGQAPPPVKIPFKLE